jgi:autotransporter-associated beta strand protein
MSELQSTRQAPQINRNGAVNVFSGTTIFTSNNAHIGGTTINAGTLQLGDGGTTGSIVGDVANHAIFAINRSDTVTFGVISGTGRRPAERRGTTTVAKRLDC